MGILYQVQVTPTMLAWPAYIWSEFKDWLWYLTTDSTAANGFPLSAWGKTFSWVSVLAITWVALRLIRKRKLI